MKEMLPQRERIVRKAKERAVESLHEITTNQKQSANNTSLNNSASKKKNKRSYKPFPEQIHLSDDEPQANTSDNEFETPTRKNQTNKTTSRRKAQTSTLASKENKQINRSKQQKTNTEQAVNLNENDMPLFNQVQSGHVSTQSIVDDWIETYKKDKETAMMDLIKLIVRSSGCRAAHMLNKEILKTKEFTDAINDLIEYFNDENDEHQGGGGGGGELYPFIQNTVQARRFKSNFGEFLQLLINQCQYSIIYDQFMLDILITFLIGLADSQVRAFRHTATLAVLKIMTALVDVLLALSIAKDACVRQHENERQKSQMKRASDRIEMLSNKRKEIEENEYEIQNFINFIFKAVFVHRYRDICSDIRCVCINEIGEWMKKCPAKFLDDTFLKYIGWTLYDRVGECRLRCLQALQPLYEQEDLSTRLELFTSRFKNRIVEMSLDKEYDVSVNAIKLLTTIVAANDAALEDKDCENIYELVYHTNRAVAQAAGEFLNQKLFVKVENPLMEFRRGKKQSENSTFIQLLVQFLIESELHDHPTYLVDAMWDLHPMLKDWECMTDLLLEDPMNPEDVLDDTHERYLVEIMTCCVRQAATGEYPIARRTQTNRKLTAKESKQVQDDRMTLTQHFIVTLPNLITKYIADAEKLVYLLQIPTYFDLNQYTLRRQEKNLEKLLKLIQDIVTKHNDSQVLEECSKCLAYLCDEDNSVYIKCNLIRSTIMDDLVHTFTNAMGLFEQLTEVDENEMYPLIIALKRLSAFAENHNIVNYDLANYTFTILKWAVYNEGFGHDFVNKALNLARSVLTWNLQKLNVESQDESDEISKEQIEYVSKLSKKFYKLCNKLFVNENSQIEEEAYFELCDLLILFNIHLANQNKNFSNLILECSTNDINMLSVYVMNNVFTEEAKNEKADTAEKIERLHKRRCILASFAKLICFNCVPIKYAAEIFRGYIRYASSYGDIIKHLLSTCRDISKVNTARTIALALQREFNEATITNIQNNTNANRIDRTSPEFASVKDLAHRFCLSFGPEASVKSREAIVTIHYEAIRYVTENSAGTNQMAPLNLPFLEVIVEFSSRLTPHDKKSILAELDKWFARRANKLEENQWQPYYTYRLSLMEESSSLTGIHQTTNLNGESSTMQTTHMNSLMNISNNNSTTASARKRKQNNNSLNAPSGLSMLKETINKNKKNEKVILEEEEELDEVENENNNEQNQHADATANELDGLKLSKLNDSSSSAKGFTSRNGTKRSRSPLVSNNSINESIDVFTSTRIEPTRKTTATLFAQQTANLKSSIAINSISRVSNLEEDEDETLATTPSKRKRRSDDPNDSKDNHMKSNLRKSNPLSVS